MTQPRDTRGAAADLPSFLGDQGPQSREPVGVSGAQAGRRTATEFTREERDGADPYARLGHGAPYADDDGEHAENDSLATDSHEPLTPHPSTAAARAPARAGGLTATLAGGVIGLLGAAHGVDPEATAFLADSGWTAASLMTVGIVFLSLGLTRRRLDGLQRQLAETDELRACRDEDIGDRLDALLERDAARAELAVSDQQLEHLMLALQRQDQKINNLTKATKMYGKPLMEVATQTAQIAGTLERSAENACDETPDLAGAFAKLDSIAAATITVRRQLEDGSLKLDEVLEQLRAEGSLMTCQAERQAQLTDLASRIDDGVQQLRRDDVAGIEACVRDVQREIAALATSISRSEDLRAKPGGAPDTGPPSSCRQDAPDPTPSSNSYATGARKSGGQNVLGAIAKLKQLKG